MLILGDWLFRVPVRGNLLDAYRVILLSGFISPFDVMPRAAQVDCRGAANDAFHAPDSGVILRGADLWELRHSSARRTKRSGSGVRRQASGVRRQPTII